MWHESQNIWFRPTHDFLKWGVECWEIFSVDIIITELFLTIEGARWWVARLCVPIALILRSQIGCQLIISRRWLTEFTRVSPSGSLEIAPILLLCCSVCQVFMFSVPILQFTSHTHTPFCMRGAMYSSLSPVILRFVCSEDTQRGGLEPSYFWVVWGPHLIALALSWRLGGDLI